MQNDLLGMIDELRSEPPPNSLQAGATLLDDIDTLRDPERTIDLAAMGFDKLTPEDIQEINQAALHRPGLREGITPTAEDVPFYGSAVQVRDLYKLTQAGARFQAGDAEREDQMALLMAQARSEQDPTFWGGVGEFVKSFGVTGAEMAASGGVYALAKGGVKAGIGAAAKNIREEVIDAAVQQSQKGVTRKLAERVGDVVGIAGTRSIMQEVMPRLIGGDDARGAWTLNDARRAFPKWEMTDEEAKMVAGMANDELVRFLDDKSSLALGLTESFIQNAVEQTGGALVKVPPFRYMQAIEHKVMQKIAGGLPKSEGLERLAQIAAWDGATAEVLEEIVGGMTVEGLLGESVIDGLPEDLEELAQLYVASTMPGGAKAALTRARSAARSALPSRQQAERRVSGDTGDMSPTAQSAITFTDADMGRAVMVDGQAGTLVGFGNVVDMPDQGIEGRDYAVVRLGDGSTIEVPKTSVQGAPAEGTGGRQGTSTATGGDVISPPGSTAAATAPVDPGVSPVEFQAFVESGQVTPERVQSLARRVAAGQQMTPEEVAMYQAAGPDVEAALAGMTVDPGVSPAQRQADVDAYREAVRSAKGGEPQVEAVEAPEGAEGVTRLLERFKVRPTYVRAGSDSPAGYFPGEGRAVINLDATDLEAVALHEAMHTWDAQQSPERRAELDAELAGIDADFMARVRGFWQEITPIQNPSEALTAEETRATATELLAPLITYLDTPRGASDLAKLYTENPGLLRRTLEAIHDFLASFVPLLPASARTRAQANIDRIRGDNPESAVQLASALLNALDEIRPVMGQAIEPQAAPTGRSVTPERIPFDQGAPAAPSFRVIDDARAQAFQGDVPVRQPAFVPPRPGDRVRVTDRNAAGGTRSYEAEVLEATGSGDNVRLRVRRDGTDEGSASENRAARQDREAIVNARDTQVLDRTDVDPTSRRAKNRTRAEAEQAAGAEPRFSVAPPTDSAAFKRWFGDSKVVDSDGAPLVVYHGTTSAFTVFSLEEAELGDFGAGLYFASTPDASANYAEGDGGQILPVYLSISNPATNDVMRSPRVQAAAEDFMGFTTVEEVLQEMGYDGIAYTHPGGEVEYVVFDATKVKSATGNVGTFDPENPDIRYSTGINAEAQAILKKHGLAAPVNVTASFLEEAQLVTRTDKFLRSFSDEATALDRYFRAVKELGGSVAANPISAFRRYFGKIAQRGDEIEKRFKDPIMDIIKKSKIAPAAAGEYVEARHIPEANESFHQQYMRRKRMQEELKVLRKRDTEADRSEEVARRIRGLERDVKKLDHLPKRLPDGVTPEQFFHEVNPLSGMKTSEARAIQRKADAESPGYHEIGKRVDSLNRYTRDRMLADQLITQEQYDEWSAQFQHYVPLRTAEVDKPEGPRSAGMSVRGPESKRRKGRQSRADNPLIMSIVQALNAAQRGEKNAVGLEFRDFLNSNKGLLESVEAEKEITYDEKTGKPNNIEPKEFHVKVGGRDTVITIANQDVVDALKRVGLANLQSVPGFVKTTMRVWRAMVTSASPPFVVTNFLRDIQSAMINASDVIDEYKLEGVRSSMFMGTRKAMATVWHQARGDGKTTGLEKRYDEYRENGGAIGTFTSPNFQEQLQRVESEFKRTQRPAILRAPLDTAAGAWDFVEDANQAVETAIRFSFYNSLRDRGVKAKDAALAARQLTVDFSQKGTLGSAISLIYAFFSASVGGTRRTLEALGRSKTARGITAAIAAQGFVSAFINEAISDEDDDGLTFYAKVPEWEKGKYMMLMLGDEPIKVIMPWGYSFFHNLGRLTAEGIQGKKSAGDVFQRLVVAAADNFNPIGTSPNLIHMATPTLAKPGVEIALNQNFAGNPIAPPENPFGPDVAAHRRRGSKTPDWAVGMAKAINSLTGGDDVRPGMVDLAGDHYEHIQEFIGGGTGRWVEKMVATLRAAGRGEFDPAATPFINQVYGAKTEFTDQSNFYAALDELAYQDTALKDAKKARDIDAVKAVREKYAKTLRLKRRGDAVREKVSALRKEAFAGSAPDEAKLEEMNVLMKGFYRDYLIAIGKVR